MAAGSATLRPLLTGPRRPATVVEALSAAVYLQVGTQDVVAVVARDAVRVPVAVAVPEPSCGGPFRDVRLGATGWVGDGEVGLPDGRSWRVSRWWDPAVPTVTRWAPAGAPVDPQERALLDALVDGSRGRLVDAVARLVGRGPGLTPEGDDLLAGALVTLSALGSRRFGALADAVGTLLDDPGRTTTVSAVLLRCATRGEAIPELAAFLVTGEREPLLRVGHTSGAALARGVELAMLADSTGPQGTGRTKEAA